jgi:flagellin
MKFHVGVRESQTIAVNIQSAGASDLGNYSLKALNETAANGTGAATAADTDLATIGANGVLAQTVTIAGSHGSADVDLSDGDTAEDIAKAINLVSATTGVTATAKTTLTLENLSADGTVGFSLDSGGDAVFVSASVTQTDLSDLAEAINKKSGTTGITATADGDSITLTHEGGKDIRIEDFRHSVATSTLDVRGEGDATAVTLDDDGSDGGNDSVIVAGSVTLNSSERFSAYSDGEEDAGSIFLADANEVVSSGESLVSDIDITSQSGANDALAVVDAAIATIDQIRSGLGAVQNRFESTIANLQNVAENVSAARSRIQDADFAQETAALTKAQILQQAGVAILAQSNQVQQGALQLLQ